MKAYGGGITPCVQTYGIRWMCVCVHLQTLIALILEIEPPIATEQEDEWAPDLVVTF
jgi:hypothetical protein